MKKLVFLVVVLFLCASTAMSKEVPPYSELFSFEPFYLLEQQQSGKGIQIYPNPVTDGRLTVKSEESFNLIQVLNITGEIVFNQEYPSGSQSETIELTSLRKGMYLVRIGFGGKPNYTAKIIIK